MMNGEKFFNHVSEFYDDMISFEKALVNRRKVLSDFILPGMKDAADMGCGTGLDSIALATNGLNVTSFDVSEGMLAKAAAKAESLNLKIDFIKYSLNDIPETYFGKYDLIVSLGNTLANLTKDELKRAVRNASGMLREGGTFLIQILNYIPLVNKQERIVNITESADKFFVRFYDFFESDLNFNILTYSKNKLNDYDLSTTKLYPHSAEYMNKLLTENGLRDITLYAGFGKTPFEINSSKDLVIKASK